MAKTKMKPGPKPRYAERRDYHIKLPLDLADKLDTASKHGGVIAYIERVLRDHFEQAEQKNRGQESSHSRGLKGEDDEQQTHYQV